MDIFRQRAIREKALRKRQLIFAYGVPLVVFIVGGSYFLSSFIQTDVELKDKRSHSISTRKFNLEEEHKEMIKKLSISDNYSLSRIPRPDDETDSTKMKSQPNKK